MITLSFARICGLLVVTAALMTAPVRATDAPITIYMTGPQAHLVNPAPLSDAASEVLMGEFSRATYFAAFAAHPDGRYGWASGRHSPRDARREALEFCNKGGTGCDIRVEIHPRGYDAAHTGMTVSQRAVNNGIIGKLPVGGSLWYALGPDGSWAVQSGSDGSVLAPLRVWRRCLGFQSEKPRPVYLTHSGCRLYRSPAYSIKSEPLAMR